MTYCVHECKNEGCPHSMYAIPTDGTQVTIADLYGDEDCEETRDERDKD